MRRYQLVPLLPVLVLAMLPVAARAESIDNERATANVPPTASGPVTSQGTAGYDPSGTQARASSQAQQPPPLPGTNGSGSGLTYAPIPNNAIVVPGGTPWVDLAGVVHLPLNVPAAACPQGQTGYYVYDATGAVQSIACVPSQAPGAPSPATSPLQLAQQASAQQPWPTLVVGVNPGRGLTGLPSWFWLGGGSPHMPDATATAGGLTVTVRATLIDVSWDFGDRAGYDSGTDIGRPFPEQSGVQHVYQTDSLGSPAGFPVAARLRFSVTYSVNSGPFSDLGVKTRAYTTSYTVSQLQPEAVAS